MFIGVIVIVLGFIIAELPQAYINYAKYDYFSLMLGGIDPSWGVMKFGLFALKYETYMRYGALVYNDPTNVIITKNIIITKSEIFKNIPTFFQYEAGVILQKIFNSIDVWYDTTYVIDIYKSNIIFRNINYLAWALAFFTLFFLRLGLQRWILLFITVAPALIAYLGHVEIRYFLHLYLIAYMLVAFVFINKFDEIKAWFKISRQKKYKFIILTLLFVLFMNTNTFRTKAIATVPYIEPFNLQPFFSLNILGDNSLEVAVEANKIYKVAFELEHPKSCDIVNIIMSVDKFVAHHARLPDFYQKRYYVLFKPTETGLAKITFSSPSTECKIQNIQVLK